MGQTTRPDSEHAVELHCTSCDAEYWTDETQMNDCPECGSHYDWEVADD